MRYIKNQYEVYVLPKVLKLLGFAEQGNIYKKDFPTLGMCTMSADFKNKQLNYPENFGFTINDRTTCNFEHPENFVVFECVHRLLEKGYRPEHIELEKRWNLGHDAKGGKADICVYNQDKSACRIRLSMRPRPDSWGC